MRALDRYRGKDTETVVETPSPTHVRTGDLLDELFSTMLGSSTVAPLVKVMHRAKPAIMRDMATIPEPELRQFLYDLGMKMVNASGHIVYEYADDYTGCPVTVGNGPVKNLPAPT